MLRDGVDPGVLGAARHDADRVAIYNHILGRMAENEDLQEQAKANNGRSHCRRCGTCCTVRAVISVCCRADHRCRSGDPRGADQPPGLRVGGCPGHAATPAGVRRHGRSHPGIVDGAVGLVELALDRLGRRGVVELEQSVRRRWCPTCWSCCGDARVTPVVSTGSFAP